MRDFTKSMMSYGWAMSMLGVQQMVNLLTPGREGRLTDRATETFENVTNATANTFGRTIRATFDAGDNMQRGMVDVLFGGFLSNGCDPSRWTRTGTGAANQAADWTRQAAQSASDYARYAAETAGYDPGASSDETGSAQRQRPSRSGSQQSGCCGSSRR